MAGKRIALLAAAAGACWCALTGRGLAFSTQPTVGRQARARGLSYQVSTGTAAPGAVAAGYVPQANCCAAMAVASIGVAAAAAMARRRQQSSLTRSPRVVACRALTDEDSLTVDALMGKYGDAIKAIRKNCADILEGYDDTYLIRHALEHKGDVAAAVKNVKEVVEWRNGKGKPIVEAAAAAVKEAKADGKWNNAPVLAAAPHSAIISKFLTGSQILVVSMENGGDLASLIRASAIDDKKLMDEVSVDELVEFFLYAREVNFLIAEERTRAAGRIIKLLAVNDLSNVSKFPDDRFQKALTGSSKMATTLYPGLSGPTVILNLPGIVRLLVTFLTPLFPGAVQSRLKFAKGPMAYLKDLTDVLREPTKSMFIQDLTAVLKA
mmetsp:Transcript_40421/g.91238  ORF Transcript_40421/g.91238 Transcript_40421/m.91238 type:complete len:380 (-) Transcript_40421:185-1324(-)|eukprot:CAMPEP_0197913290 /NCGR_PEP_ID=MMETSP1439-20131203/76383_1 /TAXON_ID=66791 /ORGANISM="Gonyaulax spinifera, Strain CCMP409" /LENGTH=379 /DNA_ID=CAMNT_0043535143 /DNA_START=60 /DNA_END=1199 /DNA_ORIENTATION=-